MLEGKGLTSHTPRSSSNQINTISKKLWNHQQLILQLWIYGTVTQAENQITKIEDLNKERMNIQQINLCISRMSSWSEYNLLVHSSIRPLSLLPPHQTSPETKGKFWLNLTLNKWKILRKRWIWKMDSFLYKITVSQEASFKNQPRPSLFIWHR